MINVTPIAISANSQQYAVSITEHLCQCYCLNATVQPQAEVKYSVASQQVLNGMTYLTILAKGSITYMPRGSNPRCCCRPLTKMFTESFDVIFAGVGIAGLAIGSTALLAAVGAWIFGGVYANSQSKGNQRAIDILATTALAERAERVNHQNNQTPNNLDIIRIITNAQSPARAAPGANASA